MFQAFARRGGLCDEPKVRLRGKLKAYKKIESLAASHTQSTRSRASRFIYLFSFESISEICKMIGWELLALTL